MILKILSADSRHKGERKISLNEIKKTKSYSIEKEERSASPEKLNECIRVGNAGGILLIIALIIAAASLMVWGFTGSIPETVTELIAVVGGENETRMCMGFIDVRENLGVLPEGTEVNIRMPDGKNVKGRIAMMPPQPMSTEEVKDMFGGEIGEELFLTDWMLEGMLEENSYSYMLYIEAEEDISDYWHQLAEASIITKEVKPFSTLIS